MLSPFPAAWQRVHAPLPGAVILLLRRIGVEPGLLKAVLDPGSFSVDKPCEHVFVRCDFCDSLRPRWSYPVQGGTRSACEDCRQAIEGDDREALLNRALLIPLPRTVSDRYQPRFREQAKRLHAEFWEMRDGPGSRV